jgi:protein tyrosine phosphatase
LKLEWNHPNRSNGEIKFFCINVTSARNKIQNQLTLTKGYKLTYVHRVDAAQLLPLILYTVSISANNGLEGEILTAKDTSPPRIPSLEQDPRIVASNNTIVVPKPANGSRQSTYGLYLLVADHQGSTYVHPQFKIHEKELRLRLSKSKIVYQVENFNRSETIDIVTRSNLSLVSGEVYNVTVIVTNTSANKTSYKVYHLTFSVPKSNIVFLGLLVLLLIPVCIFCVWYRFKTRCKNKKETPPELDYYNLRSISRREQADETKCEKRAGSLSRLVQISEFERYVAETENNEDLQHQHSLVLQNRNSVVYEVLCGNQYFDYIDLEFTDGTKITKAYIAAEAPKPTSVDYFWKAVWEENVEHIVSLVPRDGNSAEEYFPREDKKMEFQNISVLLGFDKTLSNYQYRTFILISQDQIRQVDHIVLRYRGEDALEFVPTLRKMSKYPLRTHSPIFICSSGSVKMTGFILLCDMCLRMADKDGVVDVLKNLKQLSTYTTDLVCDVEQYKLAHRVVSECLFNKQLL